MLLSLFIILDVITDNPYDPHDLGDFTCGGQTVNRKARSFQLTFENTSSFEFYFYYPDTAVEEKTGGRNVVFGFDSAWSEDCTIAPTQAPTTEYFRMTGSGRSADVDHDQTCEEDEDL